MDSEVPPSKRRRIDSPEHDSLSAGPAPSSPHELERSSRSSPTAYTAPRGASPNQEHSGVSSDTPGEFTADADSYLARNAPVQSPSRDDMPPSRPEEEGQADEQETHDDTAPERNGVATVDGEADQQQLPTPETPRPPPKPDRVNYRQRCILGTHVRGVSAVQFSPDGSKVASGGMFWLQCQQGVQTVDNIAGADGALKVWDTRTGKLIHTFEGHLAGISTIAWSPDGETIATGADDKLIRLWNVLTGKAHPKTFSGHHNYVYSLAFSPKGNILVSGSYDEAVFLWDVRSAKVMRQLPAHSDPVAGVDVCFDGTLIASCSSDGLIRIWDTMTGQCLRTLVHDDNPAVMSVRFSPNGKYVLAWSLDDCVRLWDYVEGRCIKTYQGHVNRKYSLCGAFGTYSAPGGPPVAFAVSGSEDGSILCWDVVSKKVLQRIQGHTDVVLCVDTTEFAGKRLLASCGLDRTVRLWEEVEDPPDDAAVTNSFPPSDQMDQSLDERPPVARESAQGEQMVNGVS